MRENKANMDRTLREEEGREEVRLLMNESGEPAPVDMTLFSRRTGQIIAHAAASNRRYQP
jgi:hypothetical protein